MLFCCGNLTRDLRALSKGCCALKSLGLLCVCACVCVSMSSIVLEYSSSQQVVFDKQC